MQKHGLFLVERDAALIDNQKIALPHERFGDCNNLLVSRSELADEEAGIDIDAKLVQNLASPAPHLALVQSTKRATDFVAEEDVLLDCHGGHEVAPLMNDGDASSASGCRRQIRNLGSIQLHRA